MLCLIKFTLKTKVITTGNYYYKLCNTMIRNTGGIYATQLSNNGGGLCNRQRVST